MISALLLVVSLSLSCATTTRYRRPNFSKNNYFHKSKTCSEYFLDDDNSHNMERNAYINARYEINLMDDSSEWNDIDSRQMKKRIYLAFHANVSSCVHMIDKHPVWYVTIFKAGNNNIRANLQVTHIALCFLDSSVANNVWHLRGHENASLAIFRHPHQSSECEWVLSSLECGGGETSP